MHRWGHAVRLLDTKGSPLPCPHWNPRVSGVTIYLAHVHKFATMPSMAGVLVLALMGVVFHFIQEDNPLAMLSSAFMYPWTLLQRFNQRIANWITSCGFSTSARKVLGGELLALGFALMQIGEWFLAITCWVLLGILGFVTSMRLWAPREPVTEGRDRTPPIARVSLAAISVIVCTLLITLTSLKKPENEPWSSLQKLSILGKYRFAPISISPLLVHFHKSTIPNNDGETYPFTITNNEDRDVYMISAEFLIKNEGNSGNTYYISMDNIKTPTFVLGCRNLHNEQLFLLGINRLSARTSIDLKITRQKPILDAQIVADVRYFTYDPQSFSATTTPGQTTAGMNMVPNDNLNCEKYTAAGFSTAH
jgi:hypothetical protein